MVKVSNLIKKYGKFTAVNNISFSVKRGETVGILGPNGAGKTTVMNVIAGVVPHTGGEVQIGGYNMADDRTRAKQVTGYMPEYPPLYNEMKVDEYLCFVYELKKVKKEKAEHIESIMELTGLYSVKERLIKDLSNGYCRRVALAAALIGEPELLILDEPTAGLDPEQIANMRQLIKRLSKDRTIIISSHLLSEIEALCERVIIIDNGEIIADGNIADLSACLQKESPFILTAKANGKKLLTHLKNTSGIKSAELIKEVSEDTFFYRIFADENAVANGSIFDAAVSCGGKIIELSREAFTLEQIYLTLTENSNSAERIKTLCGESKGEK